MKNAYLISVFITFLAISMLSADDSLIIKKQSADMANIEEMLDSLVNEGYFVFDIESPDDSALAISQYGKIRYGDIKFLVDESDTNILFNHSEFITGQNLYELLEIIAYDFADRGYPFASVSIDRFDIRPDLSRFEKGDTIYGDITIHINQNDLVYIDGVHNYNNIKTQNETIRRQMLIRRGDIYRASYIEKAISRVDRIGTVNIRGGHRIARDARGNWYIGILAEDIARSNAEGLVTFFRGDDEKIEIGGKLEGRLRNIWGAGREFDFRWERLTENNARMHVSAYDPNIAGSWIGTRASFEDKGRETYKDRSLSLGIEYPLGFHFLISIGMEFSWIIPDSTGLWSQQIPYQDSYGIIFGAEYNSLDNADFPIEGYRISSDIVGSYSAFEAPKDAISENNLADQVDLRGELTGAAARYFGSFGGFIRFGGNGIIATSDDDIPLPQMVYLGGFQSVRGHLEEEVFGERAFFTMTEFRLKLAEKTAIFPFFDIGAYQTEELDFIYGYGFGMISETAIGMLSISYGLNPDRSLLEGLLHFGIRSEF